MPDIFDDIAPDQPQRPPDAVVARGRDIFDELSPDPLPYRDYAAERPGIARPPIPEALQTDERFRQFSRPLGPEEQHMFEKGGQYPEDFGPTLRGGVQMFQGGQDVAGAKTLREGAAGVHKILGGVFEAATPAIVPALAAAPVATAVTVGAGTLGQQGVEEGLVALGLPREYAAVAGDLAGVIAAALGGSAYNRMLFRAKIRPILQDRVNAEYAARQAAERAAAEPRQLEAGPDTGREWWERPAGPQPQGDIFDALTDEQIAAGGEAPPQPPQIAGTRGLLRGPAPGEPGRVYQMPTGRFPGQPGEVIPQGPAYGLPRALPPVEDPGTPLGRVEKGLVRVQDLSEPELIEFMRQLDARAKARGAAVGGAGAAAVAQPAQPPAAREPEIVSADEVSPTTPPPAPTPPAAPIAQPEPSQAITPTPEAQTSYTPEEGEKSLESARLTPQQALDQWGKLQKGQIIDTPEGSMTIVRADAQGSRQMPRITVEDQNGRASVPSKKYVERWADESQWAPAPEASPTPARVFQAEVDQKIAPYFAQSTDDFRGRPAEALDWVRQEPGRFAAGAIPHSEFEGGIGLLHGEPPGPNRRVGFGVAHTDATHPGYLDEAIQVIPELPVIDTITDQKTGRELGKVLSDGRHRAVVSADLRGSDTPEWLLTAYERQPPVTSGSVGGAPAGSGPTPPESGRPSGRPPAAHGKILGAPTAPKGGGALPPTAEPITSSVTPPPAEVKAEPSEAEFQKAYNADLETFRKEREKHYPSEELMKDWAALKNTGKATTNWRDEKYHNHSHITTEKRVEGKGKKRKEVTSYIVDVPDGRGERRRYTYDWDKENDWAAAKALAQARGIPGISNDLHAAMMNRGEYVQWHERLYAIRNALKAAMPGVKIPDLSTAVKPGENVTLKRAIKLVAESLPRNLGDVSVPRPGSYLSSDEKYYGELRDKLKPYQERLEAAAAVVGRDHPRVLELEKLIEEKAREIDKAEAVNAEEDRKRQEEAAEKLKDAAERDVKRGARFGGKPGVKLQDYAKAKGWKSEGEALQAQGEKHFGVKPDRLEPSDISGLKLKKHELDILREANLDPEGTAIPRRLTQGQAQELRAKGLIDAQSTKLTEAGERAALAVRAADLAKQQGQPMSEYKPGRGLAPDPGDSRFTITAAIPVKGGKYHDKGVWHTDGHFAAAGEPPKNWSEPPPGERSLPDIDRVIPSEPGAEVKPVGFGTNPADLKQAQTLVYFSNRGAVNSVYYDYISKRYAPDKWTSAGPKEPFQAWKDGKQVAILMGMRTDNIPPGIEKLMPAQPAEGMKPRPKREKGSLSSDLATLGLAKFITDDVVPTLKAAGAGMRAAQDDLLKWLAPAARGPEAKLTALSTRANAAELARSTDRAQAALRVAGKFFDSQNPEHNYEFMERIEAGEPQPNEDLQAIADVMRKMLDTRREQIRALGTGKLESFIENYFPHIWKEPEAWSQMWENLKKRPMEGSKSFLKKRTIDSIAAGLECGLEPISDNPVDLVLMKSREMDKYLMAHRILKELKERGIARFLDAREFLPKGYAYIDDKIATVFGRPSVTAHESYDPHVMERLEQLAQNLGIPHERVTKLKSEGLATKGEGVKTKFGSPESVLAHEIGHQLEWKYNLTARLKNLAKKQGVKGVAKEMRDLADLRVEGLSAPPSYLEYIRDKDEKMANAIAALVYAPKKFQATAPETWDLLRDELWHIPELKPLFDIEPSMVLKGRQAQIEIPGLVIKGHFVAPEPAARVLNNYLSPGLREKSGLFRAYLGAANFLNQAQLGWSAFHAGFTTAEAMVSRFALGIYQAAKGSPLKGLRSMATMPIAPFTNVATGHKMVKEWEAENAGGDPWITKMVDAVVTAGGRAHMDQFYTTKITEDMMKAFRRGNIAGGVLRLPLAVMEQAARPIMEWLVPRQKLAAFADLASFELERLGPDASTDDVRAALARAWDSIDNRFGQLVYDNLFWDKVWKDAAMASVRSVGWNVGTIRELGGAVPDTAKFSTGKGDFTPRMAYMLALPVVAALMGATLYYLWHGEAPKHLVDYYFPPDSKGQRWSLPTYVKDVYHWTHDPVRTAKGKIHPFLGLILDMLSNRDFANKPIRNPNHPLVKQAQELAKHVAETALPLSVKNVQQNKKKGLQETVLPFVGVTPAPKHISQPAAKQTRGGWGGAGGWSDRPFPAF